MDKKYDTILCNNVLNVIKDDSIMIDVINNLLRFDCKVIIKIYSGDKSGVGRITKINTYQRNLKAKEYVKYIDTNRGIQIKGDFILIY